MSVTHLNRSGAAMTWTRLREVSTAVRTSCVRSAGVSVEVSPDVSQIRIADTPASIWRSHSAANAMRSMLPLALKGVGMSGMKPASHLAGWPPSDRVRRCCSCDRPLSGAEPQPHRCEPAFGIELDGAREFDDGLGVTAVLEQCVFDRLGAIDEQAAKQAVLLLRDPVAATVAADEDECGGGAARWRFDKLHGIGPFGVRAERACHVGRSVSSDHIEGGG